MNAWCLSTLLASFLVAPSAHHASAFVSIGQGWRSFSRTVKFRRIECEVDEFSVNHLTTNPWACRGTCRVKGSRAHLPLFSSLPPGTGGDFAVEEEDLGMAPVDLEQQMGSFSPEWGNGTSNDTGRGNSSEVQIKGSVIDMASSTFPYNIASFPPLAMSEVYYNGTSERYWWNQDSDTVCVYVPVPRGFCKEGIDFVVKPQYISLKLDGEEVLSGTPFYLLDAYESLYLLDAENDPPYVQLELYKVRDFQNWEDLLLEGSLWTPGGKG
ncbi:unnamed protein product [Discosporangium mesarthrocarpum]